MHPNFQGNDQIFTENSQFTAGWVNSNEIAAYDPQKDNFAKILQFILSSYCFWLSPEEITCRSIIQRDVEGKQCQTSMKANDFTFMTKTCEGTGASFGSCYSSFRQTFVPSTVGECLKFSSFENPQEIYLKANETQKALELQSDCRMFYQQSQSCNSNGDWASSGSCHDFKKDMINYDVLKGHPYEIRENPDKEKKKGARQYICKYPGWDKVFYKTWNLVYHFRIHTNVKPFQCKYCGKRFTQKANMKKHLPVHDKSSRKFSGKNFWKEISSVKSSEISESWSQKCVQ